MSEPSQGPVLRIVAGNPTPEEVAVVVSVLSAVASAGSSPAEPLAVRSWTSKARALGTWADPGPTRWRDSGLPR